MAECKLEPSTQNEADQIEVSVELILSRQNCLIKCDVAVAAVKYLLFHSPRMLSKPGLAMKLLFALQLVLTINHINIASEQNAGRNRHVESSAFERSMKHSG